MFVCVRLYHYVPLNYNRGQDSDGASFISLFFLIWSQTKHISSKLL